MKVRLDSSLLLFCALSLAPLAATAAEPVGGPGADAPAAAVLPAPPESLAPAELLGELKRTQIDLREALNAYGHRITAKELTAEASSEFAAHVQQNRLLFSTPKMQGDAVGAAQSQQFEIMSGEKYVVEYVKPNSLDSLIAEYQAQKQSGKSSLSDSDEFLAALQGWAGGLRMADFHVKIELPQARLGQLLDEAQKRDESTFSDGQKEVIARVHGWAVNAQIETHFRVIPSNLRVGHVDCVYSSGGPFRRKQTHLSPLGFYLSFEKDPSREWAYLGGNNPNLVSQIVAYQMDDGANPTHEMTVDGRACSLPNDERWPLPKSRSIGDIFTTQGTQTKFVY